MAEQNYRIELRRERLSFEHPVKETGEIEKELCLSNRLILPLKTGEHTECRLFEFLFKTYT